MPEASLVIKAEDRYSDAVRKMSQTTKSLNKNVDDLGEVPSAPRRDRGSEPGSGEAVRLPPENH